MTNNNIKEIQKEIKRRNDFMQRSVNHFVGAGIYLYMKDTIKLENQLTKKLKP